MRKYVLLLNVTALFVGVFNATLTPPRAAYAATDTSTDTSVTVETIPGDTLSGIIKERTETSWPWYIVRASGIVAGISLILLLLSGIGSVTGHTFRFLDPLTAWATHRALGITFLISVLVHMLTLLFDHFVPFNIIDILVPWASSYRTVTVAGVSLGSLYVALGVLAFYGALIVVVTSLLIVDKKPNAWKFIHYLSYLVIFDVFVHALFLGTDTGNGTGRVLWLIGNVLVVAAIVVRLRRAGAE